MGRCLHCFLVFWLCTDVYVRAAYKRGDVMLGGIFNVHFKGKEGQYGALYPSGLGRAEAMRFAIEKINNDSSLLPNVTLGYDIRDYFENATKALQITLDLIKEDCSTNTNTSAMKKKPIAALVGPFDSGTALLVGGLLQVFHIPGISGTTTSSELSSNIYKHFYRTAPSDRLQAKAMADIIEHFRWTYVAAVGLGDSYGRNGIWSVQKEATLRNTFCVAHTEFLHQKTRSQNIKEIVWKLKQHKNIKVIILWMYGGYGRAFLAEANHQNLTGRVWILSEGITSEGDLFLDRRFSILDRSIGIQPHKYPDGEFKDYLRTLVPAKSANTTTQWWKEFWMFRNCSTMITNTSFAVNSEELTICQGMVDQMYSSYIPYVIDAVYAVAHALDIIYNGTNSSQGVSKDDSFITSGHQVELQLYDVAFDGLTGKVEFDELGDPNSAFYDIVQFHLQHEQGTQLLKKISVGKWQKNASPALNFHTELFWNSESGTSTAPKSECAEKCEVGTRKSISSPCCWQCIPCLPGTINPKPGSSSCIKCPSGKHSNQEKSKCVDLPLGNLLYFHTGGVVLLVLSSCGIAVTFCIITVFWRFCNTPIVKASNRNLSIGFLIAIALLFSLVFFNLVKPTDALCKMRYMWRYATYNLCTSILLVKILRIANAFQVEIVRCSQIRLISLRTQILFLVVTQISLLLIMVPWLLLDPPYKINVIHPEERILVECKAYNSVIGEGLFFLSSSYILLQTFLCALCSFRARNIPENFSETKRMAFSMYIFLLSLFTYYPVEFSLNGWYVTVIDCVTTLLGAFGFIVCIFFPKMYIIFLRPELNNLRTISAEVSKYSFGPNAVDVEPQVNVRPKIESVVDKP